MSGIAAAMTGISGGGGPGGGAPGIELWSAGPSVAGTGLGERTGIDSIPNSAYTNTPTGVIGQIRVTVGTHSGTGGLTITHLYVGDGTHSSSWVDFINSKRITWNGGNTSVTLTGSNQEAVSDWIPCAMNFTSGRDLIIATYQASGATNGYAAVPDTNARSYYDTTFGVNTAATEAKNDGLYTNYSVYYLTCVKKVEFRY